MDRARLQEEIESRVSQLNQDTVLPSETPEDRLLWFVAYQMAADERQTNGLKDDARVILNGRSSLDLGDVDSWLVQATEDGDEEVIELLNDFYQK